MKGRVTKFYVNKIPVFVEKTYIGVGSHNYTVRFLKNKKSAMTVVIEKHSNYDYKLKEIVLESYDFIRSSFFNKKTKNVEVIEVFKER